MRRIKRRIIRPEQTADSVGAWNEATVNCLQAESTKTCVKQQNVMTYYSFRMNSYTTWGELQSIFRTLPLVLSVWKGPKHKLMLQKNRT